MKYCLSLIIALSLSHTSFGTHVLGSEITYRAIDSCQYEVTVVYFRNCAGVPMSIPSATVSCLDGSGFSTASKPLRLTLDKIEDITPYCDTAIGGCDPVNTRLAGSQGFEKHSFIDTINLCGNQTNLTGCETLRIETGQCCRTSNITTGTANQQFQTFADIHLAKAKTNSSPVFSNNPVLYLSCNQAFRYNIGAIDTVDFDSLSFSFGQPRGGGLRELSYTQGTYSFENPFGAFFQPIGNPTLVLPKSNPPVGIYLDELTGDLVFTPTVCDEVTVAVIEVTEWRKDSVGIYQKIGLTRRDMQFITQTTPNNYVPEIQGTYSYEVCEGDELCFNVNTFDQVVIPPPPNLPGPGDSVQISWNGAIPGASFDIVDSNARLQSGRFCWTPPQGTGRNWPYTFTVTARDNACPLNALTTRAISIRVNKPGEGILNASDSVLLCEGEPIIADGSLGSEYMWSTSETSKTIVPTVSGTYSVTITSGTCLRTDTTYITLWDKPVAPILSKSGDSIVSNLSGGTHYWFLDGNPTSDGKGNIIGVDERVGDFSAIYQDVNGCISDTSNTITRTVGISKMSTAALKVYPNPTAGNITIDATGLGTIRSVKLYNSQGQLVEHQQTMDGPIAVLSWTTPSGIYHAVVHTDQGLYRAEVVNVR